MRKITLSLLLALCCSTSFPQNSNKDLDERHQQSNYISTYDSLQVARDIENNTRNTVALTKTIRDQQNKQKTAAYWRIGIGLAGFALLIFGLMRKKKPRVS